MIRKNRNQMKKIENYFLMKNEISETQRSNKLDNV